MKRKMRGVIFDLDGVLVSTDRYHFMAWKKIADELGLLFDERKNNRLRGVSRAESLEIILESSGKVYSESEKAALCEKKNEIYRGYLRMLSPADVAPGAKNALRVLKKRGYRLAIGSSSKNAKEILKQIGLLGGAKESCFAAGSEDMMPEVFDAISDGTNISRGKPNPEVFIKAASFLHLSPNECCVVDDAASGAKAGKAAGMVTIKYGASGEKGDCKEEGEGWDYVAADFAGVLSMISKATFVSISTFIF